MRVVHGKNGRGKEVGIALAIAAVALVPAVAIAATGKARPPAIAVSFDKISSFTPAGADPKLAATFGSRPRSISDFTFTPAAAKGRPSQLRVAVRAAASPQIRASESSAAALSPLNPTNYNLGVAVGWKRFAVAGDVEKQTNPNLALTARESAVVGVSYNLKKFTGRVAVGAERNEGRVAALSQPDQYSVDVGAAYNLSRRIAVTGGVRYRVDQDRLNPVVDQRRDSQAVYVGTAVKF
ncbi:porin [Sphingomonas rhizophila]|uniref:Porin n=1 Tax=Sphingomonas rhizophila TaxID=2071607 RepID=A0A7G9SAI8_9SPHN|nr:porin [Sphingomonas rhizophila]QNN64863.1 porin [Sphingomonas rhizophila]